MVQLIAGESQAIQEAQRGRDLAANGRFEEALSASTRALQMAKQEFGARHAYVGFILDDLASLSYRLSRLDAAIGYGEQAVAILDEAMPGSAEATMLGNNLASFYAAAGRYQEAEPHYRRSYQTLHEALGDTDERTAAAARNLGIAYLELAEPERALGYLASAADAQRAMQGGDSIAYATALLDLAAAELALERTAAAGTKAQTARSVLEGRGASAEQLADAEILLARVALGESRLDDAEALLRGALERLETAGAGDSAAAAQALYNLGFVNILRGRFVETEPLYKRALAAYRASVGPRHPAIGNTLHSLALTYHSLGQFEQATSLYREAMAVFAEGLGSGNPKIAETRVEFAAMLTEMGEPAEAEAEVRAALQVFAQAPGDWALRRGYAHASLGFALHKQGRLGEAAQAFESALTAVEAVRGAGSSDLPPALTELALIRLEQGRLAEAEPLVRRALAIRERDAALTPWGFARSQSVLARIRAAQGHQEDALAQIRRATAVMRDRLDVGGRSSLALGETVKEREVFERHLEIAYPLLEEGRDDLLAELFEVAQFPQLTGTAAAVSRMAARFAVGEDSLGQLLRQRQDVLEAWTAQDRRMRDLLTSAQASPAIVDTARAELADLDQQLRTLDTRLRERFPEFGQLIQPRPVSLRATQALLGAGEALLVQVTTASQTYLFLATADRARMARTPLTADGLAADVASLRRGLELRATLSAMGPFDVEAAHRLYRDLFAPFETEIGAIDNLLFVPDGAMQNLTPAVLLVRPAPEPPGAYGGGAAERFQKLAFLGLETAFSVLPSVSALKSLRMIAASARAPRPFVGFGDPVFGGQPGARRDVFADQAFTNGTTIDLRLLRGAAPLPDTRDELLALAASFGARDDEIYLGPRATEQMVRSVDLSAYRTVAFATHGVFAGEFRGIAEAALILTIPDADQTPHEGDGVLLASEIASLDLNADWVLLSACNTAAPAGRPGAEGLSSLAQAFFYAGARALLVSHWYVVSSAAVRLTTTAARELAHDPGISRAEALRRAMLSVAQDPKTAHPVFWAPFVVVGAGGS